MADDTREIIDLTLRYAWALDTRQFDELDDVFTPDATGDLRGRICTGRDEIKARIAGALARFDVTQHITTNHQVVVDGDTATCRTQLHSQHVNGESLFVVGGIYEDRMARTQEGWRITHRRMHQTWQSGTT